MHHRRNAERDREIERVIAAWRLTPDLHRLGLPAPDRAISLAEEALERPLPAGLKALYRFSDGFEAMSGNLMMGPLFAEGERGLIGFGDRLRAWGWLIPSELLMFGGNGADELFGVWYPPEASSDDEVPVVMVGSVVEPACLSLAGTDLPRFLVGWSSYYLVLDEAPSRAFDTLGLPASLRRARPDASIASYLAWADPQLPDPDPDPYARGLDANEMREVLQAALVTGWGGGERQNTPGDRRN